MDEPLTEAGSQYLENFDVLEDARQQLAQFLGSVRDLCQEELQSKWGTEPMTRGRKWPGYYTHRETMGTWVMFTVFPLIGLDIKVNDPTGSETEGVYQITVSTNQTRNRKLKGRGNGVLERVAKIACEQDLEFSWDDLGQLAKTAVKLNPKSATDTAAELVAKIWELIRVLLEMEKWVEKRA